MNEPRRVVAPKQPAWIVLAITFIAACIIAWTDRRFYLNAGYNTDIRPSYWPHGVLLAFYAGAAFALARAAIWKTALVVLAGLSFGFWSLFVVDAALGADRLPAPMPAVVSALDGFAGRDGAGSLFLGIAVSGLAAAIGFGLLTRRLRVGLVIAGVSLVSGLLAIYGWGEAMGRVGSQGLLMASSILWHTAAAFALLCLWPSRPRDRSGSG